MFCTLCGNEIEQHARFCSKCGHEVPADPAAPASARPPQHNMNMHINILAWLLIGSGILTAFGSFMVLFAGSVMRHMPVSMLREMEIPPGVPHLVGWLTGVMGLAALALAVASAAAGVGLLQYQSWARMFAIIIAVLLLFHFPIGTVIGGYAFWVLLSKEGQQFYKSRSERTITPART